MNKKLRDSWARRAFSNDYQLDRTESFLIEMDAVLLRLHNRYKKAVEDSENSDDDDDDEYSRYHQEYVDHVGEENAVVMDATIGASLVVAQAFVTAMKQTCKTKLKGKVSWDATDPKTVMSIHGVDTIVDINGLANFFKHRDEWDYKWFKVTGSTPVDGRSKAAVDVAKKYKIDEYMRLDLVDAMVTLFPDNSVDGKGYSLRQMIAPLKAWRTHLLDEAEKAGIF